MVIIFRLKMFTCMQHHNSHWIVQYTIPHHYWYCYTVTSLVSWFPVAVSLVAWFPVAVSLVAWFPVAVSLVSWFSAAVSLVAWFPVAVECPHAPRCSERRLNRSAGSSAAHFITI